MYSLRSFFHPCVTPRSKYSPQHPDLEHSHSSFNVRDQDYNQPEQSNTLCLWQTVSPLPNTPARRPPLVSCPRLLARYIRN